MLDVPRRMTLHGPLAILLVFFVLAMGEPVLHSHDAYEPALYDEECSAARLATCAGSLGPGPRPLQAAGGPPPLERIPDIPPPLGVLTVPRGAIEARAPPSSPDILVP